MVPTAFLMHLSLACGRATPLPMPVVACVSRARTAATISLTLFLGIAPASASELTTSSMTASRGWLVSSGTMAWDTMMSDSFIPNSC